MFWFLPESFDILLLHSVFSHLWEIFLGWLSWFLAPKVWSPTMIPKYFMITKPKRCNNKTTLLWHILIFSMERPIKGMVSKSIIILILIWRKSSIGIFNSSVKIHRKGCKPKHRYRNSHKFIDHWNQTYYLRLFVKKHKNVHPLDRYFCNLWSDSMV